MAKKDCWGILYKMIGWSVASWVVGLFLHPMLPSQPDSVQQDVAVKTVSAFLTSQSGQDKTSLTDADLQYMKDQAEAASHAEDRERELAQRRDMLEDAKDNAPITAADAAGAFGAGVTHN
mgnify:CR=1 FL=1